MNTATNFKSENAKTTATIRKSKTMKHLLSTAALCLALHATPLAANAPVNQPAPVEETLHTAFDQLIKDAKEQMMRDPENALEHALNAENLARNSSTFDNREMAIATAMWLRGESLVRSGKPEEAASVIQNALDLIGDAGAATKLGGDLLLVQGRIASRASDVETAVKSFFKAHDVFVAQQDKRSESITLMAIGSIYRDAQAYDKALDYYSRASEIYPGDTNLNLSSFNNQANTLKELNRYAEARTLYNKALEIAEDMESDVLQARILTNIAELETLSGNHGQAIANAQRAMNLLDGNDGTEWARFVYGAKAHAMLKKGNVQAAAALIDKAFDGVDIAETSMSFEEMHDVAYQVRLMQGDYAEALEHHQAFKRLSDNAKKVASSANVALLGARFQSSEQKLNIERLKNEQLQKDVMLENAERQMTMQIALMAVGGIALMFILAGLLGMRKHRNRVARMNAKLSISIDQLNTEIDRRKVVEKDLVTAKDEAEEASRMKSTFLATMSHELRTPMNGILGFSRILQGGDLNREQREYIGIIEQSGNALLQIINDILDVSQMEAGKLKLTEGAFNLRTTINDAVKLLQPKALEKDLTLAVQIDPELPALVNGDADRIRQIVVNLVGNAVKFTETGTVAVMVEAGEGADDIKVSVVDTGIGIAEDKVDILFNRFAQADGSSTRKYGGTGLGLAICKELVEAMGGEIGVETVLGEGSKFWTTIPMAAAESEEMAALPQAPKAFEDAKRVVVIDSVAVNREVYARMLPAMNIEVAAAASAGDAFETLSDLKRQGAPVDAVIISTNLDDVAPADLASRLGRNALIDNAKLILSAPTSLDEDALTDIGFDASISQPMTDATVHAALQNAMTEEQAPAASSGEVISLARSSVTGRVLVVEDNAADLEFISALIAEYDVTMDTARNGAEAVEAARETAYDMILMDAQMPTMNGIEATRRIRRIDGANVDTPIIALSAKVHADDQNAFIEAGMDDYLAKPLQLDALRAKVKSVLSRRKPKVSTDDNNNNVVGFER